VDKTEGKKPMKQNMLKVVEDKQRTLRDWKDPWTLFFVRKLRFDKNYYIILIVLIIEENALKRRWKTK